MMMASLTQMLQVCFSLQSLRRVLTFNIGGNCTAQYYMRTWVSRDKKTTNLIDKLVMIKT